MNANPFKFRVGQTIEWSSQSAGSWLKKQGKVVAILEPGSSIREVLAKLGRNPDSALLNAANLTGERSRYLVETTIPGRRETFYAPECGRCDARGKVV